MSRITDLLRGVGQAAGVAGQFAQDESNNAVRVLAQAKAARETENDRVANLLKYREINTPRLGDTNYAETVAGVEGAKAAATAPIDVKKAADTAAAISPITTQTAANTATATAPITQATHEKERLFDNAHAPQSFTPVTLGGADGTPAVVKPFNNKTGTVGETVGNAKAAPGGAAKPNESQEKSMLFYNLMKNSEPDITSTLGSNEVRQAAITGYLHSGPAEPIAYAALNNNEKKLVRAMRDFSAGVLRKESGAAVTPAELQDTFARFFPAFGDAQGAGSISESKTQARQNYMETMRQQALPASNYYAAHDPQASRVAPRQPASAGVPSFEEWMAKRGGPP